MPMLDRSSESLRLRSRPPTFEQCLTRAQSPSEMGKAFGFDSRDPWSGVAMTSRSASSSVNSTPASAKRDMTNGGSHQSSKDRGARFVLESTIALYRQIGVNTVYVNASEVGRYVWASAGFDFLEPSMRDKVLESVRPMARNLGFELRDDTLPHAWSLAILGPDVLDNMDCRSVRADR